MQDRSNALLDNASGAGDSACARVIAAICAAGHSVCTATPGSDPAHGSDLFRPAIRR